MTLRNITDSRVIDKAYNEICNVINYYFNILHINSKKKTHDLFAQPRELLVENPATIAG